MFQHLEPSEKSVGTLHVMNCRHGYPLRPAFHEGTRVNVTNLPTQEVAGRAKHVAGTRLSLNRRPLRRQIREIAIDRAFGHLQLPGQDR
jgi:hypothetical protein